MRNFNFSIPQSVLFGEGSLHRLSGILKQNHMDRVLIVSDGGLERLGVIDKVSGILREAGADVRSFLDVKPNPSIETVEAAVEAYRTFDAAGIVAVGGGSPMDVAKSVGVLAAYGGPVSRYEGLYLEAM